MNFKDFVLSKTQQELRLESDSILLGSIELLVEGLVDSQIKEEFEKLINKHIKRIGKIEMETENN